MLAKIGTNEKALKVLVDYGSLSVQVDLRESQVRAILSHLCSVFAFMGSNSKISSTVRLDMKVGSLKAGPEGLLFE